MNRWLLAWILAAASSAAATPELRVYPKNPLLFGKGSTQRLTVHAGSKDVTEEAVFVSEAPSIAQVSGNVVEAAADGGARIRVSWKGLTAYTTALVQRASGPPPASFAADILPVLTKYGCNGGSCHGALNGQNGFKLSLFGYEPENDYEMIVRKHDGRRLSLADPEKSLLLRKPTFDVPHGGGKLLKKDSPDFNRLVEWIRAGAKGDLANERRIVGLRVSPESAVLYGAESTQRLAVTARYSDGAEGDVTHLVKFQANDDSIASVSASGLVTALRPGETAIAVRGPGVAGVARIGVVLDRRPVARIPERNFIDRFINDKLQALHVPPSPPADDAMFLRRAYLDIIGVIPSAAEARAFLADKSPDKRTALVNALLKRPEYADHWSTYWGDHLSNTKQMLYNKGPYTFTLWLNRVFRENVPYDKFVRLMMTSTGGMYDAPATSYYPLMKKEQDLASVTSQLFLGISIECARCHNHPLERWTQDDYNGMAAFFSQVRYKSGTGPRNNERVLYLDFARQFQNPDTKKVYLPKPLDGSQIKSGEWEDRRELLVEWLTSRDNPYFAKALVNRMWRNFMGRGFVEPVDDFRATNPPTNEPLLNALARDFADNGYDLHHLIRRITSSSAYQLSSEPAPGNKSDTVLYARYYPRRLAAEQLLDSISLAIGVPEKFPSMLPGTRAAQLPEPEIESYFLEIFDRPSRQLVCERKNTNTLNQALHMIGGDTILSKMKSPESAVARLLAREPAGIIEELYLRTVSRYPDEEERRNALDLIAKSKDKRSGVEDVFWALLNAKEFLYTH